MGAAAARASQSGRPAHAGAGGSRRQTTGTPAPSAREPPDGGRGLQPGRAAAGAPDRPTAVALVQNTMTVGLYHGLSDAGILPGRELSIVGSDQSPNGDFLRPSLTQFRLSLTELASGWAARSLR
nr:substrate-binding domain-containing protein [Bradyrhizobium sp.]